MPPARDLEHLGRDDDWGGVRALVLGGGTAAFAVADNLSHLGANVVLASESDAEAGSERAELLGILGVEVCLGDGARGVLADGRAGFDLAVLAPGPGDGPGLGTVVAAVPGLPVWGELDLAWRLRDPATAPPWLVVATDGITDTPLVLDSILRAAGLRAVVGGEVGLPLLEAVMDPSPYDVLVAALDPVRLEHAGAMRAHSAAVLSSGPPVLGRAYEGVEVACVYDVSDRAAEDLVREADVTEGARAIGVTLGMPGLSMVGVVEDVLADRAFVADRATAAAELGTLRDLAGTDPRFVLEALAAAALARAFGAEPAAVREGLRSFGPPAG